MASDSTGRWAVMRVTPSSTALGALSPRAACSSGGQDSTGIRLSLDMIAFLRHARYGRAHSCPAPQGACLWLLLLQSRRPQSLMRRWRLGPPARDGGGVV